MCYNFSMDYAKVKSYAKINLTLEITGSGGGYHTIDSAAVTVDIADVIAVGKRKKDKLIGVTMHGLGSENIPYESNNAVRAAQAFMDRYDTCGVDITVWKNIPMGAGLGGSSADVAGVLRAMRNLFGLDDEEGLKALADGLGSDCAYMLYGGYARLTGRGEQVEFIPSGMPLDIAIVLPSGGVSTAECYKKYDSLPAGGRGFTSAACAAIEAGDKAELGKNLYNGLFGAACALNGGVGAAYGELESFGPYGVTMTGSGSAVFALFENDSFARYAQSRYRGKNTFILTKTKLPRREDKNGGRKAY